MEIGEIGFSCDNSGKVCILEVTHHKRWVAFLWKRII